MTLRMGRAVDAGLARRAAALGLDLALGAAGFALLNLLLYKLGLLDAPAPADPRPLVTFWWRPAAVAALAVTGAVAVLATWRGMRGTPGALLAGMMIVRARDGAPAGAARLAWRLAVALALAGLGTLWSLGGRPALHDRLSGTRAVVEDEALVLDAPRHGAAR